MHRAAWIAGVLLAFAAAPGLAQTIPWVEKTALHDAARRGDVEAIRKLLREGADPNAPYNDRSLVFGYIEGAPAQVREKTPLMFAVESRKPQAVEALIEGGADVHRVQMDSRGHRVATAFDIAVKTGQRDMAERIWEAAGRRDFTVSYKSDLVTACMSACRPGQAPDPRSNLAAFVASVAPDPDSLAEAIGLVACTSGQSLERLEFLRKSLGGRFPPSVIRPCLGDNRLKSRVEMVRYLLGAGGDARARVNPAGWTPLHVAAFNADVETVDLLLRNGANVNAVDDRGTTPLMLAAGYYDNYPPGQARQRATIERLLEAGADPARKDKKGEGVAQGILMGQCCGAAPRPGYEALCGRLRQARETR